MAEGLARKDRRRRRARGAEGRHHLLARHGHAARRHPLSRRFRGAPETGRQGARGRMPNAVLFIDEIHTVIGAGATSGGAMDASNLLKPALASGSAALHRLDHLQGIPPALREGPRPGASLPEDRRQRADGRGHDRRSSRA
ncbi:MAG: hypothetical protein ACWGHP_10505 [Stenotrophomonas sp.]